MSNAARLVKAMQKASAPKENEIVDIVVGTVTSVSPLKIKVGKIELTSTFLILSALCQEKKITIPATENQSAISIVVWRGLKVGDDVHMIRCCQGQKYYVLQRKEGVE